MLFFAVIALLYTTAESHWHVINGAAKKRMDVRMKSWPEREVQSLNILWAG